MQNIFHTIQSELKNLAWPKEQYDEMWRFVLSLPFEDLEQVLKVLKSDEPELLATYRDEHPMWQALPLSLAEWQDVVKLDFATNKYRLARAVYSMTTGLEQKEADEWREWLEALTNATLQFKGSTDEVEYYERMYTLLTWWYLRTITRAEFDFIMGNYFIVKAMRIGLDVPDLLAQYINSQFVVPSVRHDVVEHWVKLLDNNKITLVTGDGTDMHTVSEWLAWARAQMGRSPTDSEITKFMSEHTESSKLLDSDKDVLSVLIRLYANLKSGAWDNHPQAIKEFSETIFEIMEKDTGDNPNILQPIEKEFRMWFAKEVGLRGRQKIVLSLMDRIDISAHIETMTRLNEWCNELDKTHADMDLFYYDEAAQKFLWNEELFAKDPTAYKLGPTITVRSTATV